MGDVDYLMEVIDWELNVDPNFRENHFMRAAGRSARSSEMEAEGYVENWICYKSAAFSAKELTVLPGRDRDHQGRRRLRA